MLAHGDDRARRSTATEPGPGTLCQVIDWFGPKSFTFGGERFRIEVEAAVLYHMRSELGDWVLGKDQNMVQRFLEQHGDRLDRRRVVELGIFEGGSVVFDYLVCKPDRLVAVELRDHRVAPLDEFVDRHGLGGTIRLHYGVDQGDLVTLTRIVDEEFAGAPIDLVIDDASHLYAPTRASFEVLFPRLRPNGVYVIEDWDWAHHDEWQAEGGYFAGQPALTNLVVEILMFAGTRPDIVTEVSITERVAEIVRGPAELDGAIDLSSMYLARGRVFEPVF